MKVTANLVFDKVIGEHIAFTDLGDPDLNFAVLEKADEMVSLISAAHSSSGILPEKRRLDA